MDAQAGGVAHALLAYVALERALAGVVLVPDVHLQVVPVGEEPVARRAFHATAFAVPSCNGYTGRVSLGEVGYGWLVQ